MKIEPKEFTLKSGEIVKIYSPSLEDAQGLADNFNIVTRETRNLSFGASDATMKAEDEFEWILEHVNNERSCMICASISGKIVGASEITHKSDKPLTKHRSNFGISIQKAHWHKGIGSIMMQTLCETAKNIGLEQIELEVVATNLPAKNLYKKMGFVETGVLPHGLKYEDGTYADLLQMVKFL